MKFHFVLNSVLSVVLTFLLLFFGSAYASNYDPKVEELQRALILTGFKPGKADGLWGGRTENALKKFIDEQELKLESVDYHTKVIVILSEFFARSES